MSKTYIYIGRAIPEIQYNFKVVPLKKINHDQILVRVPKEIAEIIGSFSFVVSPEDLEERK